jgi:hypothetical protein
MSVVASTYHHSLGHYGSDVLSSLLGGLSSTPQVLGLTPRGSEFQVVVKKTPSSVPRQSKGLRLSPGRSRSHMGFDAVVYGWGRGSGVFSTCVKKVFLIQYSGVVLPPQSSFFLIR